MTTRSDRWIPWSFVGGFGIILIANGIMVFNAFDSWTGLSTDDAYRRGLAYNEQLAQAQKAEATGWQIAAHVAGTGIMRQIHVTLHDKAKQPIRYADIQVAFQRPIERGHDFTVTLRSTGNGRYAGQVQLPKYGQWRLRFTVSHAGERVVATRRFDLR